MEIRKWGRGQRHAEHVNLIARRESGGGVEAEDHCHFLSVVAGLETRRDCKLNCLFDQSTFAEASDKWHGVLLAGSRWSHLFFLCRCYV